MSGRTARLLRKVRAANEDKGTRPLKRRWRALPARARGRMRRRLERWLRQPERETEIGRRLYAAPL